MLIRELDLSNTVVIDAEELQKHMKDPRLKIFDIRGEWGTPPIAKPDDYFQGHIPNACYLDWTRELIDTDVALAEAPVPDDSRADASFASLGIHADDLVVLYDDDDHMFASRLWWVMQYFGLKNVKVLNGGWKNWCACGYEVSIEVPAPETGSFRATRQEHLRCEIDAVIHRSTDTILLDGRGRRATADYPMIRELATFQEQ
jgi:thiosulfate/3-mercaptopyruvate sulfurtransferase